MAFVNFNSNGLQYDESTNQYRMAGSTVGEYFYFQQAKLTIEGDQDDVDLDNDYGKLTTTLNETNIFVCEVTPSIGNPFKIPMEMLLGNVLFGFPRPDANNFTFKITYI